MKENVCDKCGKVWTSRIPKERRHHRHCVNWVPPVKRPTKPGLATPKVCECGAQFISRSKKRCWQCQGSKFTVCRKCKHQFATKGASDNDTTICRVCGRGRDAKCYEQIESRITEKDIERTIAEQMKCLPPWWEADVRRQLEKSRRPVETLDI